MFGYVTIYHKGLAKPELDRYQAYYCGLCRTLGQKYGLPGQLTLSYDLAFIAILHSALYEPQTQFSAGRCAPHPIKARPRAANEFLDYAADMTIALAYYNFLDNWQDDHSRASLRQAKKLEGYLPAIRARWPRQTAAITAQLDALNALEKQARMIWMPYAAPLAICWARCSPAGRTSGPPPCRPWAGGWADSFI